MRCSICYSNQNVDGYYRGCFCYICAISARGRSQLPPVVIFELPMHMSCRSTWTEATNMLQQ